MNIFPSSSGEDAKRGSWADEGGLIDSWAKKMEEIQRKAAEKLQKKATEVQKITEMTSTWSLFAPPSVAKEKHDAAVSEAGAAPVIPNAGYSITGEGLQKPELVIKDPTFTALPSGPAVALGGGTPSMTGLLSSAAPSPFASDKGSSANSPTLDFGMLPSDAKSDGIDVFAGGVKHEQLSTPRDLPHKCGLSLNTSFRGADLNTETGPSQARPEGSLPYPSQQNSADHDFASADKNTVPDLWMRPLPLPEGASSQTPPGSKKKKVVSSPSTPSWQTTRITWLESDCDGDSGDNGSGNDDQERGERTSSLCAQDERLVPNASVLPGFMGADGSTGQGHEDPSICSGAHGVYGDGEDTHDMLLQLAASKGAKIGELMLTIEKEAADRDFPLAETIGHPFKSVSGVQAGSSAASGAGVDRSSGRLRDAVREAAAKGLSLLIAPNDKTSGSGATSSPEGCASGPGSSPAGSAQSLTPGHPSPPGSDETWSDILSPVKQSWEAKVSSMRQNALVDLGKIVRKLPAEARESASSMLGILGSGVENKSAGWKRQTVVTREGHLYEGEVNDDGVMHRDGYGRLTWPDGHWFQGEFAQGETCGLGRRSWPTGHAFSGMEHKGSKHGLGIYTWPDGRRYEGEFRFDVKDGIGLMCWPNNRCYLGEWKRGLQNGDGIEWRSDGCFVTVYEAGRIVCDQQAPPSVEARFALVHRAASMVPEPEAAKSEIKSTRTSDEELPVARATIHPIAPATAPVSDIEAHGSVVARGSSGLSPACEGPAREDAPEEPRKGRRRGAARQVPRHTPAAGDDVSSDDEASDSDEAVEERSKAPDATKNARAWNLTVVNGEVIAVYDDMVMSPTCMSKSVLNISDDLNDGACMVFDDADIQSMRSPSNMDQPRSTGTGAGAKVTKAVMNRHVNSNDVSANLVDGQEELRDSPDSSLFDASPTSFSSGSVSTDSSDNGRESELKRMLNYTGSDKMNHIVELFQGGSVRDMVEEDAEAGLAERLAGESDAHAGATDAEQAAETSQKLRGGSWSDTLSSASRSRASVRNQEPETADAQFPSSLLKAASKTSRSSSRGSRATVSSGSQASASPNFNECKPLTPPSPFEDSGKAPFGLLSAPALCVGQQDAGGEAATAVQHAGLHERTDGSDEEEEVRAMEATKQLWDASAAGDSQLVALQAALKDGARADWRDADDRGNCALHKAAEVGALALVQALLKAEGCWGKGAAPSSRNTFNDTPLHAAAFKGHHTVVEVLIEAQADVNARSDDGESPLHCAAFGGHAQVCQVLLRSGGVVDAVALREGDTALHLAVLGRHAAVVEVLLSAGARTDVRNKDDCSAHELADIQQHEDVIEMLRNSTHRPTGAHIVSKPTNKTAGVALPATDMSIGRIVSGDLATDEREVENLLPHTGKGTVTQKKKAPGAQV